MFNTIINFPDFLGFLSKACYERVILSNRYFKNSH